jgi:hypothetical protein
MTHQGSVKVMQRRPAKYSRTLWNCTKPCCSSQTTVLSSNSHQKPHRVSANAGWSHCGQTNGRRLPVLRRRRWGDGGGVRISAGAATFSSPRLAGQGGAPQGCRKRRGSARVQLLQKLQEGSGPGPAHVLCQRVPQVGHWPCLHRHLQESHSNHCF